ncbi:MAG: hypothetical protein C4576_00865 [Desulfobacteraceae bacterium]|nr:MAG: hypothetical protein C4576_00865 [Desulfobacteraceae bacterium]
MKRIIWVISVFLVSACATAQVAVECDPERRNFSVEIPPGWEQLTSSELFLITRKDPYEQYILFRQRHVNERFPHTAKRLHKGMAPLDVAGVIVDEMKSDPSVLNLQLIETEAALVGSYPGFKILFDYGVKEGHSFSTIYYGFLQGDWLYSIRYNASQNAVTEQDVADFHQVLKSFRCRG